MSKISTHLVKFALVNYDCFHVDGVETYTQNPFTYLSFSIAHRNTSHHTAFIVW